MDGDFSEKLKAVLADPEALAKISRIAGAMGAQQSTAGTQSAPGAEAPELPAAANAERDPKVALLYSLKPLLKPEKREKIDGIAKAMALVTVLKNIGK